MFYKYIWFTQHYFAIRTTGSRGGGLVNRPTDFANNSSRTDYPKFTTFHLFNQRYSRIDWRLCNLRSMLSVVELTLIVHPLNMFKYVEWNINANFDSFSNQTQQSSTLGLNYEQNHSGFCQSHRHSQYGSSSQANSYSYHHQRWSSTDE